MPPFSATSIEISGHYSPEAAGRLANSLRESLGRTATVAFAFASPDYAPHIGDLCETIRVDGHVLDVVGCTAGGRIEGAREIEDGPGCVVLALACETGDPVALRSDSHPADSVRESAKKANGWIMLANPYAFPGDELIYDWNAAFPGVPCVGGLASGGGENELEVFLNGRPVDGVAVPVTGKTAIVPVVSQGCRPIGEPLTVTRAENNVLYALGGQPAYQALESAFQTLSENEKSHAKGNLFAGLAGNEYLHDFKSGDFLIRNIIGADPDSGAVVIAGIPRIGQTLQYQIRDRDVADADLNRALASASLSREKPFAALVFSCLGRGEKFFGSPNHDASRISAAIGGRPSAGFFCNGEIGPVAGRNALQGYTAAAAVWVEKTH